MDFRVENEEKNIKVELYEGDYIFGKAICYFEDTPIVNDNHVGCIGDFEADSKEHGIQILNKCEEILREKGVKLIVAPMNGNTWKQYRTLKYSNGEPPFVLEKVNPIEHNEILLEAGFRELHTYTSNKGAISDAYQSESLGVAEKNVNEENIYIRSFNRENPIEDLKKIYNVSKLSFNRNPFYTPISEEEFIKQYEPYINMVDPDIILIAEKDGQEVGFVFCIPNFNEAQAGGQIKTIILKTIAVNPNYEHLGLGNVLLNKISNIAKEKGFTDWIFAFMFSNNTSQKMAKRNNATVIREYALYGKDI